VLAKGTTVLSVVDGDDHTEAERVELRGQGIIVLRRRSLETYLLSDEVLTALCEVHEQPDKAADLIAARDNHLTANGHLPDDFKKARQVVHQFARNQLHVPQAGNAADTFVVEHLAPLAKPGTTAYEELKASLFG
jgi:hypothetical protein